MSTIAYDGVSIAADRRGTTDNLKRETCKLYRFAGDGFWMVAGWTGCLSAGLVLYDWYRAGANPQDFPKFQDEEKKGATFIVASRNGVMEYGSYYPGIHFADKLQAWGSGRDFALAAMACGKTAEEAVKIAAQFDVYTSDKVDVFVLE